MVKCSEQTYEDKKPKSLTFVMFNDNIDRLLMRERIAVKKVVAEFIKNMTTKDAKRIGLSKMQMFRLKKKIKEGKKIKIYDKVASKIDRQIIVSKSDKVISVVIGTGFVDGFLAHIKLTTGQDVSETGILYTMMNMLCKTFSTVPSGPLAASSCYTNLFWYGILIFVVGIAITLGITLSVGDWKFGTILYVIGFAFGFGILYL